MCLSFVCNDLFVQKLIIKIPGGVFLFSSWGLIFSPQNEIFYHKKRSSFTHDNINHQNSFFIFQTSLKKRTMGSKLETESRSCLLSGTVCSVLLHKVRDRSKLKRKTLDSSGDLGFLSSLRGTFQITAEGKPINATTSASISSTSVWSSE